MNPNVLLAIPLLPLAASIIAGLGGRWIGRAGAHTVTCLAVGASCVLSVMVLKQMWWDGVPTYDAPVYTWLVSDAEESPHLSLGKVKGELYIACAEHDKLAPLPMVEELRGLFARSGNPGELEMYPAVHHGFAFPQRWCFDQPAAERHWERLIALYRRRLG